MARLPRFAAAGQPQHVIQRGNNRTALFQRAEDYLVFRECTLLALQRHPCRVHAYVFMTNHVHFLLTADESGAVGRMMQSLGRRFVRYFNDRYQRTGSLWEGRYRATVISTDEYLFTCYRYIEQNPVRAGMVSHPDEYQWSSYAANALGSEDSLVTEHERFVALGTSPSERRQAYRALFRDPIDPKTLTGIRDATNHAWALGSDRFQVRITRTDRRASRARRGARPRTPSPPAHTARLQLESDPIRLIGV